MFWLPAGCHDAYGENDFIGIGAHKSPRWAKLVVSPAATIT
jgi:hypothetical protein